jgi:hypothetical protein
MQRMRCFVCGSPHPAGFILGRIDSPLCRSCRDITLTFLHSVGVEMTEANPFISDLCIESHVLESAWFEYYDNINQCKGIVIRTRFAKDREGLVRIESAHPNQQDFWLMDDS